MEVKFMQASTKSDFTVEASSGRDTTEDENKRFWKFWRWRIFEFLIYKPIIYTVHVGSQGPFEGTYREVKKMLKTLPEPSQFGKRFRTVRKGIPEHREKHKLVSNHNLSFTNLLAMIFIPLWLASELYLKSNSVGLNLQLSDWQLDVWRLLMVSFLTGIILMVNTSLLFEVDEKGMGSHAQTANSLFKHILMVFLAIIGFFSYYTIRSASPREIGVIATIPYVMLFSTAIILIVTVYSLGYTFATFTRYASSHDLNKKEHEDTRKILSDVEQWKKFFRNPRYVGESEPLMRNLLDDRIFETFILTFISKPEVVLLDTYFNETELDIEYFINSSNRGLAALVLDGLQREYGWNIQETLTDDSVSITIEGAVKKYIFDHHRDELINQIIQYLDDKNPKSMHYIFLFGILKEKGMETDILFDDVTGREEIEIYLKMLAMVVSSTINFWKDIGGPFPKGLLRQSINHIMTNWGKAKRTNLGNYLVGERAQFQLIPMSVEDEKMMDKLFAYNKSKFFNLDFPSIGVRDTSAFDKKSFEESGVLNDLVKLVSEVSQLQEV
jgi:hypothetical protein